MFKIATGKGVSIPAGIGFGIVLSVGITGIGAALIAYLLSTETLALSGLGWSVIGVLAVASFAGAILASRLVKGSDLPVSLGVGIGYVLVLLGCTALFFGGQYQGIVATLITVLLGSGSAGFLRLKGKKFTVGRKKLHAYR